MKNQSLATRIAAILASTTFLSAQAQDAATPAPLEEIIVTGSQLQLPEPFAGGQIACGGRAGILGNLDLLETPFASTSYTAELILNQQAETFDTDTRSFAIADTLSFAAGKSLVTVGAREQTLETEPFDYNSGASTSRYDESKLTPVGGIVYRRRDSLSFYANYIEGLVAGDIPPTVSNGLPVVNGGEALDPYQAEQIELGVKRLGHLRHDVEPVRGDAAVRPVPAVRRPEHRRRRARVSR